EATPRTPLTDCQEDDAFLIVYNNDLQGAKSDTEYATDDSSCKTVCGIFNPDTHLCDESDCDIPEGTCTTDTDCNAENECMVCDTEAGMCKNACERVAYLEATGTQYIRTNIDISQTDHFKATYLVSMTKRSGRAEMGYSADHHGYWGITKENFYALAARPIRLSPKEKDTILFERNIINGEENHKLWVNNSLEKEINLPSPETGIFSIFGIGRNGSYRSVGKIYIFQMTLNGTPVHDSVPVLAPNGKTCLFNKVPDPEDGKSKLYCNAGSGDFKTNKEP
ncbi:MAG: hypothetical protein ACI4OR_00535, partial [Alphaproteobacteria bacterium]